MKSQSPPASVAVIGLGYVGLPLATAFAQHVPTTGFDTDETRLDELRRGFDRNGEQAPDETSQGQLHFTAIPGDISDAELIIVAVPTPVDADKVPDVSYLESASRLVGNALVTRDQDLPVPVIVFESTVYPGCTEEICLPIIEKASGLPAGTGFKIGYSPERINFGDREHGLADVVKVVAGQDEETTGTVAAAYELIVRAGVHRAPDIKTAEAAKVIENVQRDLNIALMNELTMMFHKMKIDPAPVLAAARTKWNFLPFSPGLVGGHCIPVDPYYLTFKAQKAGYEPSIILAGRQINDSMAGFVAGQTASLLEAEGKAVADARVLVLGVAFKEDIADARNTQVKLLVSDLVDRGAHVEVYDPNVSVETIESLRLTPADDPFSRPDPARYDAVVIAVPHARFREKPAAAYADLLVKKPGRGVLIDIRRMLDGADPALSALSYWAL